jgi:hypothetical protein
MRTTEEIELLVLRALCQGTLQGSLRPEAAKLLSGYAWREPVHQAMFNCLTTLAAHDPDDLRHNLFSCLTRKGFPDIDLEVFFEPHSLTRQEASTLIRILNDSR